MFVSGLTMGEIEALGYQTEADVEALRPQATAALTIAGSGDSLTAAPTWAEASILTGAPAGDIAIDVAGCPDGASRWLRLVPADTKTVTISATGGTIRKLGGLDTNPFTGDGTEATIVAVTRIGTIYEVTIQIDAAYT